MFVKKNTEANEVRRSRRMNRFRNEELRRADQKPHGQYARSLPVTGSAEKEQSQVTRNLLRRNKKPEAIPNREASGRGIEWEGTESREGCVKNGVTNLGEGDTPS